MSSLAELAPDLVIAPASGARRLVKNLDRLAPRALCLFLRSSGDAEQTDELMDIASEGHHFVAVDESVPSEELRASVRALLEPRAPTRRTAAQAIEARFALGDHRFRAACVNVSAHGVGLRLSLEDPVERFLPGMQVRDLVLERAGQTVARAPTALIRHVRRLFLGDGVAFHVGLELGDGSAQTGKGDATISDPVQVRALLRRCQSHNALLQVRGTRPDSVPTPLVRWELTRGLNPSTLVAEIDAPVGRSGEVAELTFDLGGKSYRAWVAIWFAKDRAITLSVPTALSAQNRRSSVRFACPPAHPFHFRFTSPLGGESQLHRVIDLQATGLSFRVSAEASALMRGLILEPAFLVLPDRSEVPISAQLRDLRPVRDEQTGALFYQCGVKFGELPAHAIRAVTDAFLEARGPAVIDGQEVEFEKIWDLICTAGHHYLDYPAGSGPHLEVLGETHRRLMRGGHELGKSFVTRDEGRLTGYSSGLRLYSRTWLIQHLAVLPGFHRGESVSRDVSAIAIDYAELLPDVDFLRCMWRTTNRWSERVMGRMYRGLRADGLSHLRYVNYGWLSPDSAPPSTAFELPEVRPATQADLRWIERHLREQGELVRMLSDDLTADQLQLEELGPRFEMLGLQRGRSVYVVDGERGLAGIALANSGTRGMCWPEFTNGLSLIIPEPEAAGSEAVRWALVRTCVEEYRRRGQRGIPILASDSDVQTLTRMGFSISGRVAEWTFHRSTARSSYNILTGLFDRVTRRMSSRLENGENVLRDGVAERDGAVGRAG